MQPVTPCSPGNRDRRKESTLQENVGAACLHAGVLATHHTGHGDRPARIRDHQCGGVQCNLLAVQ